MPTPQTTELEQLLWDDEDVILEEGHSRNKLQESLRKPEGFSYATNRSIKEIEIELSQNNSKNVTLLGAGIEAVDVDNNDSDSLEPEPRGIEDSVSPTLKSGRVSDSQQIMTFCPNTQERTDRIDNDLLEGTHVHQTGAFDVPFGAEEASIELQKNSSANSNNQNSRNDTVNVFNSKPQSSYEQFSMTPLVQDQRNPYQ